MSKYSAYHQTAGGTDLPIINATGSATMRFGVFDILLSSDATPADVAGEFRLVRTTDAGTGGTALTEGKFDELSAAAVAAAVGGTFTTRPADTGPSLLGWALNQRGLFRWVAFPGGMIYSPLAAGDGLMVDCVAMSSGTPNFNLTMCWEEA